MLFNLKPHVYFVEGKENIAFYDILNEEVYQMEANLEKDKIEKLLIEGNLAFYSKAHVPMKFKIDVNKIAPNHFLRTLFLNFSSREREFCWSVFQKNGKHLNISYELVREIKHKLKEFQIEALVVMLDVLRESDLNFFVELFPESEIIVEFDGKLAFELCSKRNKLGIRVVNKFVKEISVSTNFIDYFYNKEHSTCYGHQISIDYNGMISLCPWTKIHLGSIDNIETFKLLVDKGVFAKYWSYNKNKVGKCEKCELRYGCHDCPAYSLIKGELNYDESLLCKYDPNTGKGAIFGQN